MGKIVFGMVVLMVLGCGHDEAYKTWRVYKGSAENIHYAALTEIDTNNVTQLQEAWTFHTGDADTVHHSQIQCNPIIIDGLLYGTTPQMKLFAVDAMNGKTKWIFNPFDSLSDEKNMFFILNNCRGLAYWTDGQNEKRVYYTAGANLYAIDALTGKIIKSFGEKGKVDLHDGLDRDVHDLFVTATSPPMVYKDLLIMGTRVDEGAHAAPGHIRAFDARTGKLRWIFHTIPHPGEAGYETWEDGKAYEFIGGANAWSGFSMDEKRGVVYAPIGSASYDFYGGNRKGSGLYADCLLALDAMTGKLKWHFQDIHHDVWDRDLSSAPALVQAEKDGRMVDALALTTKTGFVFLLDRETGKPIYKVEERAVPTATDLVGEKLWPTQPIPSWPRPFMRQMMEEKDINPYLNDSSYKDVHNRWMHYQHDNMFNPPSLQGTIFFPGLDGGGEWGGPTYDPETHVLYINANEMAWVITAIGVEDKQPALENNEQAGKRLYRNNCMVCHGPERKGSGNFPSLEGVELKYTLPQFHSLLQSGRRMMPAFKQLNNEEREAIASYVMNAEILKARKFKGLPAKDPYHLPYTITGYNKFLSKEGYPALSPPWGTLNALSLHDGNYLWRKPLGNDTSFKQAKAPTGLENYGASVVTKGGLLFIAATKEGKLRAFNKRTGALLWEHDLPAPGFATPAIYEINGKEFIVLACGGGKLGARSGDAYVAFALK